MLGCFRLGFFFFNFMFSYFNIYINVGVVMIQTAPPFFRKGGAVWINLLKRNNNLSLLSHTFWINNKQSADSVADPNPKESKTFCRIRIRIRKNFLWIRIRKKSFWIHNTVCGNHSCLSPEATDFEIMFN
jgi:hypothetical protein